MKKTLLKVSKFSNISTIIFWGGLCHFYKTKCFYTRKEKRAYKKVGV